MTKYRHTKSGEVYEMVAMAINEGDLKPTVVYRKNDVVWCRPASEFFDGRFVLMPPVRSRNRG